MDHELSGQKSVCPLHNFTFLRILTALIAVAFILLYVPKTYRWWTDGFSLRKVICDFSARADWDFALDLQAERNVEKILNQPFYYLGKGRQSFVFESKDKEYVLKLFRFDDYLFRKKKTATKWQRLERNFNSLLLAKTALSEETALLHLSLNPAKFPRSIAIQDKLGRLLQINTAHCRFAIQKKAVPFEEALRMAYLTDRKAFDKMVNSFEELFQRLEQKNIFSRDPKLRGNFGFLKEKAILLDFGSVTKLSGEGVYAPDHFRHQLQNFLKELEK